jgi:hypothetical protein
MNVRAGLIPARTFGRIYLGFENWDFLTALMKLHLKFMWERFATAIKIDRIPFFDLPEADKCLLASGEFDVH